MIIKSAKDIDRSKWDACVMSSQYAKPYALSWWLDAVCPKWKGITDEEYQMVIPLIEKKVLFWKRLIMPPFTQQLGFYSKNKSFSEQFIKVENLIQKSYSKGYIQLNESNYIDKLLTRKNYKLSYDKFDLSNCSKSHLRNLRKAEKAGLEFVELERETFDRLLKSHNAAYKREILKFPKAYDRLNQFAKERGLIKYVGLKKDGEVVAGLGTVVFQKTAYYLFPFTTDAGRQCGGMHYLIVNLRSFLPEIQQLDFEGSELKGVERFILGFNAMLYPYPVWQW